MASRIEKPIKNFLLDFGLTDKEITVYLSLLKTGPNTIMNLSRETGIKRSTTHNTVEELIKKGLVSQTNYGERRMVVAEDPKKLEFLMEQKQWEMKKLEDNLPEIVKSIYDAVPKAKDNVETSVKYYEGEKELRYVYDQILKSSNIYTFVNVDKIKDNFPEYIDIFSNALKSKSGIEMWEILEHHNRGSDSEDDYNSPKYHFKYVPAGTTLTDTDITIFDDNIALINIQKERPTAIIIQSRSLAQAVKNIHQLAWNLLK